MKKILEYAYSVIKALGLICFFLLPILSTAQLSEANVEQLRTELADRVNGLRVSKGLEPLLQNTVLRKAASGHSAYMALNNILSHEQKSETTSTPDKRVRVVGGNDFEIVGENVLYSTPQVFPLTSQSVVRLAEEMFNAWKNSSGHYANMINPQYVFGDFGFAVDPSRKIVYATHVFGKKGAIISGQLSSQAFGLVQAPESCGDGFAQFSNLVANMGNSIQIEDNEVVFYYHNVDYFDRIFDSPDDGIAIDLVARKQMVCGSENSLDLSSVYDGILLQPIYRDELLGNNRAQSNYRIITTVGKIPPNLRGEDFSQSIVLIQDGKKCRYLVPGFIPSARYSLRPISPILYNPPGVGLLDSGVVGSQELVYDFRTNITKPVRFPSVQTYPYPVHSIHIQSYSSVEGDSAKNVLLHRSRAEAIKRHIVQNINAPDSLYRIDAKENWERMFFQLHYFQQDGLASLSADSIKRIIAGHNADLPWDSLLFAQRQATATIQYVGKYPMELDGFEKAKLNLRTALETENIPLANKALYEMYQADSSAILILFDDILFENAVFGACKKYPDLVVNVSALLSRAYAHDIHKTTEFIFNWVSREKELSEDAKFNLLHLYTLVGVYLLDEWDLDAKRLSHVIHPNRVDRLSPNISKNELILNLHLTYIEYFGQINDGENISRSFAYIADYFRKNSLKPEDDVDLVLFFNRWSMYSMTNAYLLPKFEKDQLNEDGVFILAQTLNFYSDEAPGGNLVAIQKKAASLNKTRWCKWVNDDFQMLRNGQIKQLYCEVCR